MCLYLIYSGVFCGDQTRLSLVDPRRALHVSLPARLSRRQDASLTRDHRLSLVVTPIPKVDEIWLAALKAAGRSPHTIASYGQALRSLRSWRGTTELADLTRAEAYAFTQ
jgi:hypothetical protein